MHTIKRILKETTRQPIPKEINAEYSLKGLMPKLKFQYFGYLI